MPYRCRYCNGLFCPDHRLPENHNCEGLKRIKETPQWRDYATQVRKREAIASGPRYHERWDREEEASHGMFRGRRLPFLGKSSITPSSDVESMKRILIALLFIVLFAAITIRFLF